MRRSGAMPLVLTLVIALGWLAYTLTLGGRSPQLGLDLQGGTSVVLGVKAGQSATSAQLDQAISIIRRRVDGLGVAEPEITRQGKFIVVSLPGVKDSQRAIDLVGRTAKLQFRPFCAQLPHEPARRRRYTQALDPAAGGAVRDAATEHRTDATSDDDHDGPVDDRAEHGATARRRRPCRAPSGSSLGVPPAGHLSAQQIRLERDDDGTGGDRHHRAGRAPTRPLPGATDTTVARRDDDRRRRPSAANPLRVRHSRATRPASPATTSRSSRPTIRTRTATIDACDVLGPVALSGEAVSSAQAAIPQGAWVVELAAEGLGPRAASTCCRAIASTRTRRAPAARTAIVLDGNVESNPAPQTPTFTSTQIEISGKFTQKQADDLALVLNYGALPIQLEQQRVETVSATLGHDSLRAGLIAGLVGIARGRDLHDPLLPGPRRSSWSSASACGRRSTTRSSPRSPARRVSRSASRA